MNAFLRLGGCPPQPSHKSLMGVSAENRRSARAKSEPKNINAEDAEER
jgi:hypothetical protein